MQLLCACGIGYKALKTVASMESVAGGNTETKVRVHDAIRVVHAHKFCGFTRRGPSLVEEYTFMTFMKAWETHSTAEMKHLILWDFFCLSKHCEFSPGMNEKGGQGGEHYFNPS